MENEKEIQLNPQMRNIMENKFDKILTLFL